MMLRAQRALDDIMSLPTRPLDSVLVIFDLFGTLVTTHRNTRMTTQRPYALSLLRALQFDGADVAFWSSRQAHNVEAVLRTMRTSEYLPKPPAFVFHRLHCDTDPVAHTSKKPIARAIQHEALQRYRHVFVVDDTEDKYYDEDIRNHLITVPTFTGDQHDTALYAVEQTIRERAHL